MIMTLASLLVAVALYMWVGATLSTLFRALGGARWKAWVPLVSQVEMFRLAKRPGWHIVLLVVPLYGLVVYYQVLRELTKLFDRPTRLALIGVVLLPVWAAAVAGGPASGGTAVGVESIFALSPQPEPPVAGGHPVPPSPAPVGAAPDPQVGQYACPVTVYPEPVMPLVVPAHPVAPAAQAVVPAQPAADQPMAPAPVVVQPMVVQPMVPAPVVQPPVVAPSVPVAQPSAAQAVPPLEFPPVVQDSPWSTPGTPAPAVVPDQAVVPQPVLPTPVVPAVVMAEPVSVPRSGTAQPAVVPQPVPSPVVPVVMAEPVSVPRSATVQPAVVPPPGPLSAATTPSRGTGRPALMPVPSDFEVSDHTVVINRASPRPWSLVLEDGRSFDLWASSVVVGREPTATDDGVQMLAIPDDTRTISKMHARFDLVDGVWQVTDLGSTNGIVVTGTDGRAFSVRSGRTSVVGTQLVLGSVMMRLVSRESLARSA